MKAVWKVLFLVTVCSQSLAISEKNYKGDFQTNVIPFTHSVGKFGSFTGIAHKKIAFSYYQVNDEKGVIVMVPGRVEPMAKYAELIYDFATQGYSVYIIDHRGQGNSQKLIENKPELGHVEYFNDYVSDFKTFMEYFVNPVIDKQTKRRAHSKVYILAHSMGATIATLYLYDYHPDFVNAVVVSSPMFEMNMRGHPMYEVYGLLTKALVTDNLHEVVLNGKGYQWDYPFEGNDVTHSQARFQFEKDLVLLNPQFAVGDPTYKWLQTCLRATSRVLRHGADLKYPILLFQAGQDSIVENGGQEKFLAQNKSSRKIIFQTARHEILQETDDVRDRALVETLSFFASH